MKEGEPEVEAGRRRTVELIRRYVLAQPVAPVVREPELPGHRVPGEADRVANARGKDFTARAIGIHPGDRRVALLIADVAGRTERHVELAVGSEGDVLPGMVALGRKSVTDYNRLRWRVELSLDAVVTQDALELCDVQSTIVKRDAVGQRQPLPDRRHLLPTVGQRVHRVHLAGRLR